MGTIKICPLRRPDQGRGQGRRGEGRSLSTNLFLGCSPLASVVNCTDVASSPLTQGEFIQGCSPVTRSNGTRALVGVDCAVFPVLWRTHGGS